eukprot:105094-Prymnesium_polylepis.2
MSRIGSPRDPNAASRADMIAARTSEEAARESGGHRRAAGWRERERWTRTVALRDEAAVDRGGRQHARRHELLVPRLLLAVAEHRHLLDFVRHPLLLQPQPQLLAVRAPGVVVPVERYSDGRLWLTKEAQPCLRVGPAVGQVGRRIRRREVLQSGPVERSSQHGVERAAAGGRGFLDLSPDAGTWPLQNM